MKAVALITESENNEPNQWQYDKIMTAIAYDIELDVVFMYKGITQIFNNKIWKSLELYGVENIFYTQTTISKLPLINAKKINDNQLRDLIKHSDFIL